MKKKIRLLKCLFLMCALASVLRVSGRDLPGPDSPLYGKKIVGITIPKCGTGLLAKTFYLMTGMQGYFNYPVDSTIFYTLKSYQTMHTHLVYTTAHADLITKSGFRGVFIVRDPRDQIISAAHYFFKKHRSERDIGSIIDELISGTHAYNVPTMGLLWQTSVSIIDLYHFFLPWTNHPAIYTTSFEKLVGPAGGGRREDQLAELAAIAEHLGVEATLEGLETVGNDLFGPQGSNTFRKGQIGAWRQFFTPEHKKKFKKIAGKLLIELGYEESMKW